MCDGGHPVEFEHVVGMTFQASLFLTLHPWSMWLIKSGYLRYVRARVWKKRKKGIDRILNINSPG